MRPPSAAPAREAVARLVTRTRSELVLGDAARQLPVPIFVVDPALRVADCNDALARMYSMRREALLGFDLSNIIMEGPFLAIQRAVSGESATWAGEYGSPLAGRGIVGTLRVTPVRDADGAVIGAIGLIESPAVEPRADRGRLEAERRMAVASYGTIDALWELELETQKVTLSPHVREMLGYSVEELPDEGRAFASILHPDEVERMRAVFEAHLDQGEPIDVETRMRDREGSWRYLRVRGRAIHDEAGHARSIVGSVSDVTPVHRARAAAREAEALFRGIAEQSLTGVHIVDADGRFVYANRRAAEMFGYTIDELTALPVMALVIPEDHARVGALIRQMVVDGVPAQYDAHGVRRDGSIFPIAVYGSSVEGPKGRLAVATLFDLTERALAQDALSHALATADFERRRLAQVFEQAATFIAVGRGPNHVFELANEKYYQLVGRRELIGKPVAEALPELRDQGIIEKLDAVLATGEAFVAHALPMLLARSSDAPAETRFVDFTYTALTAPDGTRVGVVANGYDVTEQVQSAQALQMSERRMHAQFKALPSPTYAWHLVDHDGVRDFVLADFSDAAVAATGGGIRDFVGARATEFFTDTSIVEDLWTALETNVTLRKELDYTFRGTGLTRRLALTYAPARPDVVMVHTEDVSERFALEEQLRQAQKMEAVGQLAGGIAHDFNNLLSVISVCGDFLAESVPVGDPLFDDVQQIRHAAARAGELTHKLLAYSRRQVLQLKNIAVNDVLRALEPMLRRVFDSRIRMTLELSSDGTNVNADATQLEQAVLNLAVNARDAMPTGGSLSIATHVVDLDEASAHRHGVSAGPHVVLSVTDTGTGMDGATLTRVFEPFFSTKEVGRGTGLGLSMVYGVAKQLGGFVTVESEIGRGTKFEIALRQQLPRNESTGRIPVASIAARGTVLVVDDEPGLRAIARRVLERAGHKILEAETGSEALRVAAQAGDRLDVVLTDVVMPEMSGRQLKVELARTMPDVPVILMSGYVKDEALRADPSQRSAVERGAAFVAKPFKAEDLVAAVAAAFQRRRTMRR